MISLHKDKLDVYFFIKDKFIWPGKEYSPFTGKINQDFILISSKHLMEWDNED